jgi:hypothetical protein
MCLFLMEKALEVYELRDGEVDNLTVFMGESGFLHGPCFFNLLTMSSSRDDVKGKHDLEHVKSGIWFGKEFPRGGHDVHYCDGKMYLDFKMLEGREASEVLERYAARSKSHLCSQL